jgi:uncharacterized protein
METPNAEIRAFAAPMQLEQRANGDATTNVIVGYAFKYGVMSHVLGWGFREEIQKGALDGADVADVVCRSFHNDQFILGRTKSGTLRLFPDEIGLRYECDLPDTQAGRDIASLIQRGDIAESSFEFYLKEDSWGEDENGIPTRLIRSFRKITDVSPVVRAAYPETEVAKRSFEQFKQATNPPPTVPYKRLLAKRRLDNNL